MLYISSTPCLTASRSVAVSMFFRARSMSSSTGSMLLMVFSLPFSTSFGFFLQRAFAVVVKLGREAQELVFQFLQLLLRLLQFGGFVLLLRCRSVRPSQPVLLGKSWAGLLVLSALLRCSWFRLSSCSLLCFFVLFAVAVLASWQAYQVSLQKVATMAGMCRNAWAKIVLLVRLAVFFLLFCCLSVLLGRRSFASPGAKGCGWKQAEGVPGGGQRCAVRWGFAPVCLCFSARVGRWGREVS